MSALIVFFSSFSFFSALSTLSWVGESDQNCSVSFVRITLVAFVTCVYNFYPACVFNFNQLKIMTPRVTLDEKDKTWLSELNLFCASTSALSFSWAAFSLAWLPLIDSISLFVRSWFREISALLLFISCFHCCLLVWWSVFYSSSCVDVDIKQQRWTNWSDIKQRSSDIKGFDDGDTDGVSLLKTERKQITIDHWQ